jgi:hypothetical protein
MLQTIPYLLIGLVTPLLITFIFLALKYQKFGIYFIGALVTFVMYFFYGEGFVYICNSKLSVFDPFAGGYTFLLVNLQYYWQWYLGLSAVEFISGFFLYSKFRQSQLKQ